MRTFHFILTVSIFFTIQATSKTFYLDPVNGSMSNNGSSASPWTTVQAVIDEGLIKPYYPTKFPYH